MNPNPNGDQRGRAFTPPKGKMPSRFSKPKIVHERFEPPNQAEGVGTAEKSGGERCVPPRSRKSTPTMPVKR